MRTLCSLTIVAAVLAGAQGCSAPQPAAVSDQQLAAVRSAQTKLAVGTPIKESLAAFPAGNKVRLSAATMDGIAIEEWKVEAFHDGGSKEGRDLFVQFLYFADGTLVDMSDERIDFRARPELAERWRPAASH